jgi:serine/threonine protein kinase
MNPWDDYHVKANPEEGLFLAQLKEYPKTIVFIQQIRAPQRDLSSIHSVIHPNIVDIRHAYWYDGNISIVYEWTVISLDKVLAFRPGWRLGETAALCQGILSALRHLHDELGICHGHLTDRNVRLNFDGTVKLGKALLQLSILPTDHK